MISILLGGLFGLLGTLLGTRVAIGILVKKGYGQFVRDDGPKEHLKKAGTPTMGGIAIICAACGLASNHGWTCTGWSPVPPSAAWSRCA